MYLGWRRRRITWPIISVTLFLLLLLLQQPLNLVAGKRLPHQQQKQQQQSLKPLPICVHHHSQSVTSNKNRSSTIKNAIKPCPEPQHSFHRKRQQQQSTNGDMMVIDFTCHSTEPDECDKVKASLGKASEYITSVLAFKTPLYVNASYLSFCNQLGQCEESKGTIGTGQAYPSVSYLMEEGNTTRMYPQAILKQYPEFTDSIDWYKYDMNAQFNSEINWYYEGDTTSIKDDQTDLLLTIIHEFIHGLGFVSAWSDDTYERFSIYDPTIEKFLTPMPLNPPNELPEVSAAMNSEAGVQPFWGFVDFPLDKLLYGNSYPLTRTTQLLNDWGNGNIMFATILDMVNDWVDGNAFREEAEAIYQMAITQGDITINIDDTKVMVMETSLTPFQDGSSLTHADQSIYASSDDYIMCYSAMRGVNLNDLSKIHPLGPLGPSLVRILANLGYYIQPSYNNYVNATTVQPNVSFWVPPIDLVGTATNPSPAVSVNPNGPAHIPSASDTPSSSSSTSLLVSLSSSSICIELLPRLLFFYLFVTIVFPSCFY